MLGISVTRIYILVFMYSGPCHGPLAEQLQVRSRTIHLLLQLVQLILMVKWRWGLSTIHNPMYFFKPEAKSFPEILIHLRDLYFVP